MCCGLVWFLVCSNFFLYCELVSSNPWDYLALLLSCRWGAIRLGGAVVCYRFGSSSFPFSVPCDGGSSYYVVCCGSSWYCLTLLNLYLSWGCGDPLGPVVPL